MPKSKTIQSKQGFTIIEVVLVLAIAGLIFLMVFVAFPALQRSQKDTQRRQDYANFEAAIENYIANNSGKLPPTTATLKPEQYINTTGTDPDGQPYTIVIKSSSGNGAFAANSAPDVSNVWLVLNADCSGVSTAGANKGSSAPKSNGNARSFAIYGGLESGTYCQDNS